MKKKIVTLGTLWLLSCGMLLAESRITAPEGSIYYRRGVELYEKQKYAAAQHQFQKAADLLTSDQEGLTERSAYYIALCSAQMRESGAQESLQNFLGSYPNSIYANDIRFALGTLLHEAEDFAGAYAQYQQVDPYQLPFSRFDEYNFRTGYAAYMCGDRDKAYSYFKNCNSDPQYRPHAIYYIAYIDYLRNDLDKAKQGFQSIASEPAYEPIVPFYLLQIEFRQGNYAYVIEHGIPLLTKATETRQQEISRIVSEAYFHQNEYAKSLTYMNNYAKLGGTMGREEQYLAGYCNYAQGYYPQAIELLAQVAGANDTLAQNASFHLGDAYLKSDDKKKAMSAFGLAASASFSPEIREEALFNYGKLQFELGGSVFNEAITTLDNYLKEFPNSPRANEARELLLAAYFNSKNYDAAYEAIKQVKDPDNNVKMALQKIAYFRALEYYEAGDYKKALELFDVADANKYTAKYTALTKFWRAETLIKNGDYKKAMPLYESYIALAPRGERESMLAQYNLGYCYFNDKQWGKASSSFNKFISAYTLKDNLRGDAFNRLGDVAYAQREYANAVDFYNKAIAMDGASVGYARFQRAVMFGLLDQYDRKTDALVSIIGEGKSEYVDDAMYELGRTYLRREKFNEGAAAFKRLIDGYPQSPYVVSALSELGLVYQNLGKNEEALRYYKQVVDRYPSSPQAKDAMLGIKNIYVDQNDVDSYLTFAKKSGVETNVAVTERDSLMYIAADRVYQSRDYAKALSLMDNYLRQYPQGAYRADALYALGDCSLQAGNSAAALSALEEVGAMPSNRYQIPALRKAATLRMDEKNYPAAAALYKQLSTVATQKNIIVEALDGYLKAVVASGDGAAQGVAADEVLASPYASDELARTAHFVKGKALQASADDAAALTHYRKAMEGRTREAAEAHYHVISILFKENKLKEAEKEVFAFSDQNLPYQYWTGKAFLILGDIYVKQNDAFQAKATYQSIIDGYADKSDGVVEEAQRKIESLK